MPGTNPREFHIAPYSTVEQRRLSQFVGAMGQQLAESGMPGTQAVEIYMQGYLDIGQIDTMTRSWPARFVIERVELDLLLQRIVTVSGHIFTAWTPQDRRRMPWPARKVYPATLAAHKRLDPVGDLDYRWAGKALFHENAKEHARMVDAHRAA